jgi:hypothetical protein
VFRRALLEHPAAPLHVLPLQLQLTQPHWAAALAWLALGLAWASLALSAVWQGLPVWALGLGVALSVSIHYAFERRRQAWLKDHCLCFRQPRGPIATAPSSFLGTYSKNTGQITFTPVTFWIDLTFEFVQSPP